MGASGRLPTICPLRFANFRLREDRHQILPEEPEQTPPCVPTEVPLTSQHPESRVRLDGPRVPLDWAVVFCFGGLYSNGTSGRWPPRSHEECGQGGLALGQGEGWVWTCAEVLVVQSQEEG